MIVSLISNSFVPSRAILFVSIFDFVPVFSSVTAAYAQGSLFLRRTENWFVVPPRDCEQCMSMFHGRKQNLVDTLTDLYVYSQNFLLA